MGKGPSACVELYGFRDVECHVFLCVRIFRKDRLYIVSEILWMDVNTHTHRLVSRGAHGSVAER